MAKKKTTARKSTKKAAKKVKKTAKKAKVTVKKATRKKATQKKTGKKKPSRSRSSTKRDAPASQAEQIVKKGESVRKHIRNTVVALVHQHKLDLEELSTISEEIMQGAVSGVKELDPKNRESTLRKVVDGIGDAVLEITKATENTLRNSTSRGKSFARTQVKKTSTDLRKLQTRFVNVLSRVMDSAGKELSGQAASVKRHIQETAKTVQPSVESAMRAASEHPVQFASETANAAAKAVPQATGAMFHAIGGLLQDAGDAIGGKGRSKTRRTSKKTSSRK